VPTSVDRGGVRALLERGGQLVEVLGPSAYEKEHIPGAINIPLRDLSENADTLRRDDPVVVYCADSL
jgi:rhodanese-related sulfurtransferase